MSEWNVARHIFHMLFFEQKQALPFVHLWLGEPMPEREQGDEEQAWETYGKAMSIEQMLQEFQMLRAEQIALLPQFSEENWLSKRDWGTVAITLTWAVTKTYQHTLDHINSLLQLALFWDFA
jgi:hypothetical protein